MAELFEWIGGPVELDILVNILATLLDVRDGFVESTENDAERQIEPRHNQAIFSRISRIEEHELLLKLWRALKRLPPEQRDAYCFRFEDQNGNDLFSLLIEFDIATLPELAKEFRRSAQEIRLLRSRMPMDGATVAAELGVSTSQVHKWRFLASQHLKKELLAVANRRK